ncbi:MAG: hypothetical protein JRC91_03640 [Deltaproteobacteria bacterium]|nr:hypothetical protein [Deltaproteobacteria bacterium]
MKDYSDHRNKITPQEQTNIIKRDGKMKQNANSKVIVLMFFVFSDSYGEDFKMYIVYSSKTTQTRVITYDADKTEETDVDMYVTFFKGGSTKLA